MSNANARWRRSSSRSALPFSLGIGAGFCTYYCIIYADFNKEGCVIFFTVDRQADDPKATVVSANVGGMAIVRGAVPDQPSFEAAIPIASAYETRFSVPFDNRDGVITAIVVLNASVNSSPLQIVARGTNGNVIAQTSASLDALQRVSGSLTEVFPETAGQTGIVQVSTTAIGVSGLALRIDPNGRFTAIQTLSSPTGTGTGTGPVSPAPAYSGIGRSHRLSSVAENGTVVILDDGSLWEINFLDRLKTSLWLSFASVDVQNASSPVGDYKYVIVNTSRQQEVHARYLGTIS